MPRPRPGDVMPEASEKNLPRPRAEGRDGTGVSIRRDMPDRAPTQAPSEKASSCSQELESALSLERFARYRAWAGGDMARALALYALNTRVSEALYTPMQMLEVALRNRIHAVMAEAFHDRWFEDHRFLAVEVQRDQVATALFDIAREGKEPTPGRIVAALTFSFWTTMLARQQETLWQKTLHRIARTADGKGLRRKDFSGPLTPIRVLRNRIAHHEPVLHWNLPKHHAAIIRLTEWLSPAAAQWSASHSRFGLVYPGEQIVLCKSDDDPS